MDGFILRQEGRAKLPQTSDFQPAASHQQVYAASSLPEDQGSGVGRGLGHTAPYTDAHPQAGCAKYQHGRAKQGLLLP